MDTEVVVKDQQIYPTTLWALTPVISVCLWGTYRAGLLIQIRSTYGACMCAMTWLILTTGTYVGYQLMWWVPVRRLRDYFATCATSSISLTAVSLVRHICNAEYTLPVSLPELGWGLTDHWLSGIWNLTHLLGSSLPQWRSSHILCFHPAHTQQTRCPFLEYLATTFEWTELWQIGEITPYIVGTNNSKSNGSILFYFLGISHF